MHRSGGGHHDIMCAEPVQNTSCQSGSGLNSRALRINACVWPHKHARYVKKKSEAGVKCNCARPLEMPSQILRKHKSQLVTQFDNSDTLIWTFFFF